MDKGKIFSWILLVLFFVIAFWVSSNRTARIRHSKRIVNGYVYETSTGARGGVYISYIINVGGKELQKTSFLGISSSYKDMFLNKWFPVVYNTKDSEENRVLIMPEDFKEYNIDFPDSLDWVTDYDH